MRDRAPCPSTNEETSARLVFSSPPHALPSPSLCSRPQELKRAPRRVSVQARWVLRRRVRDPGAVRADSREFHTAEPSDLLSPVPRAGDDESPGRGQRQRVRVGHRVELPGVETRGEVVGFVHKRPILPRGLVPTGLSPRRPREPAEPESVLLPVRPRAVLLAARVARERRGASRRALSVHAELRGVRRGMRRGEHPGFRRRFRRFNFRVRELSRGGESVRGTRRRPGQPGEVLQGVHLAERETFDGRLLRARLLPRERRLHRGRTLRLSRRMGGRRLRRRRRRRSRVARDDGQRRSRRLRVGLRVSGRDWSFRALPRSRARSPTDSARGAPDPRRKRRRTRRKRVRL